MKKQKIYGISYSRSPLKKGDKITIWLERPIPSVGYGAKEIIRLLKKYMK